MYTNENALFSFANLETILSITFYYCYIMTHNYNEQVNKI